MTAMNKECIEREVAIKQSQKEIPTYHLDWVACKDCVYSYECGYSHNSDSCPCGVREDEEWEDE